MTRLFAIRAIAFATTVLLACGVSAAETTWLSDLDAGKQLAVKQDKDLLVFFTGTEWCGWCTALEREILSKPAFAAAGEDFVLVKLEFPANHDDLPSEIRPKYKSWRDRYGIRAYPTVLLTDTAGRPFAATGYARMAPDEYVARLRKLRQTRQRRDAALKLAATAAGIAKAKLLDEALTAVNESFDASKTEGNGNPLIAYYRFEVDQILALVGDNQAGLADKYQRLLEAESEQQAVKDFYARIGAIRKEKGLAAAFEAIEEELTNATSTLLRNRIRLVRLTHLEWMNRYAEAVEYAQELLLDDSFSVEDKRRIRVRIAYDLPYLSRVDESVAIWDDLIAEVAGDRDATWRYHHRKAEMYLTAKRYDDAIKVWKAARRFTDVGTMNWLDNEVVRARVLAVRAGRPCEAATLLEETLKTGAIAKPDQAVVLTDLAIALDKDGRRDEALKVVSQVKELLAELESDDSARSQIQFAKRRLETLHQGDKAK